MLHIGGAESAVEAWVGGRWVGCSTDSRLPAEFDITDFVVPGEATVIALRVHRWSASTWMEDQDMWWMAGIHRPVVLYATGQVHLTDIVFRIENLADDHSQADVAIAVTVDGEDSPDGNLDVVVSLVDPGGAPVLGSTAAEANAGQPVVVRGSIDNPRLWSAERPDLHRLDVVLRRAGVTIDARSLEVGVRTVAVAGGQLLVNHRRVTIRGVNRHEHDPERGRVQRDELLATDGALLKAANINAVRTAHYPDDERFYTLCDRLGFYVVDEANIETHGVVHDRSRLPADDPRFAEAFIARTQRMVERDRNHPSVIAWSLGNESGLGPNHRVAAAAVREADPTRPVHYHPGEDSDLVDIIAPMYPTSGELEQLAAAGDHRPVIMCEYSHAMGNSNGGLADYWDVIATHQRLAGGFIWDWVDQGLAQTTAEGVRWWAYGGDFDDKPNDANFNLNGLVDADRRPHPVLLHVAWVYRPVAVSLGRRSRITAGGGPVTVEIENRRDHLDLSDLVLTWRLVADEREVAAATVEPPTAAPHEVGELLLDLPSIGEVAGPVGGAGPGPGDVRLRFEWRARNETAGPAGVDWPGAPGPYRGLVSWDEIPLPVGQAVAPPTHSVSPATRTAEPAADVAADGTIVLRAGGSEVVVDPLGQPLGLCLGGRELDLLAARLGIDRAPTDNDDAAFGPDRLMTRLRRAGLEWPRFEPRGDPRVGVAHGVGPS